MRPSVVVLVDRLGQIGAVLYLGLVGLRIGPQLAWRTGLRAVVVAVPLVLLAVLLGWAAVPSFSGPRWGLAGGWVSSTAVLAAGLAVSGLPVIALILEERGGIDRDLHAIVLAASALLIAVPFAVVAIAGSGAGSGPSFAFLLWVAAAVVALAAVPRVEVAAAAVVACLLVGGWLTARLTGTALVGAFAAGILLSRFGDVAASVDRAVRRLPPLLVPVFFAAAGARVALRGFDPSTVAAAALFTGLLVVVGVAGGHLGARLARIDRRGAATTAALLNCRGMMLLALAVDLIDRHLIDRRLASVFYVGAVVTTLMTPWLLRVRSG